MQEISGLISGREAKQKSLWILYPKAFYLTLFVALFWERINSLPTTSSVKTAKNYSIFTFANAIASANFLLS
jgi:hypothetical protein